MRRPAETDRRKHQHRYKRKPGRAHGAAQSPVRLQAVVPSAAPDIGPVVKISGILKFWRAAQGQANQPRQAAAAAVDEGKNVFYSAPVEPAGKMFFLSAYEESPLFFAWRIRCVYRNISIRI